MLSTFWITKFCLPGIGTFIARLQELQFSELKGTLSVELSPKPSSNTDQWFKREQAKVRHSYFRINNTGSRYSFTIKVGGRVRFYIYINKLFLSSIRCLEMFSNGQRN